MENSQLKAWMTSLRTSHVDFSRNMDYDAVFKDRVVLITGGASGIGEALCRYFLRKGSYVVISDFNDTAGQQLERELTTVYGADRLKFIFADVSSWTSQVSLFRQALEFAPRAELDTIIPCAGLNTGLFTAKAVDPQSLSEGASVKSPDVRMIEVGLIGTLYTVQLAAKYGMGLHKARPSRIGAATTQHERLKSIVLVGSVASYIGGNPRVDYAAAKHGLRGAFKTLRDVFQTKPVRVNMIAPSFVKTPLSLPLAGAIEEMGQGWATMQDVLDAVARLAADPTIHGRVVLITPDGCVDARDDMEGAEGGIEIQKAITKGSVVIKPRI